MMRDCQRLMTLNRTMKSIFRWGFQRALINHSGANLFFGGRGDTVTQRFPNDACTGHTIINLQVARLVPESLNQASHSLQQDFLRMTSQTSTIYAELLSNIRQISVTVSLLTSVDSSTKAEISPDGRQLSVTHHGHTEHVTLPAQTSAIGSLPVAQIGCSSLSWRLPVSPTEARPSRFSLESQALPWTSVDITTGSSVACRSCGSEFVAQSIINTWKDLPSENWAEMMEFWHCHKPHDHDHQDPESLATKGYGANHAISAQQGVGFVDLTSFLFSESDCRGLQVSINPAALICP